MDKQQRIDNVLRETEKAIDTIKSDNSLTELEKLVHTELQKSLCIFECLKIVSEVDMSKYEIGGHRCKGNKQTNVEV